MAEEKKEKWLSWLALTTVVFAVGATLRHLQGRQLFDPGVVVPDASLGSVGVFTRPEHQGKSVRPAERAT